MAVERFLRRQTSPRAYEICDDSGTVVATLQIRAMWDLLDISTNISTYRMVGLDGRHVRDRRDRRTVFTLAHTFASGRHKKIVCPDGSQFRIRNPEKGAKRLTMMELVDSKDICVITVKRVPALPCGALTLSEALVAPVRIPGQDPVLFIALAFQLFDLNYGTGGILR